MIKDLDGMVWRIVPSVGTYINNSRPASHFVNADGIKQTTIRLRLSDNFEFDLDAQDLLVAFNFPEGWAGVVDIRH